MGLESSDGVERFDAIAARIDTCWSHKAQQTGWLDRLVWPSNATGISASLEWRSTSAIDIADIDMISSLHHLLPLCSTTTDTAVIE